MEPIIPTLKPTPIRSIGVLLGDLPTAGGWEVYASKLRSARKNIRFVYLIADDISRSGFSNYRHIDHPSLLAFVNALACFGMSETELHRDVFPLDKRDFRVALLNSFLIDAMGEIAVLIDFTNKDFPTAEWTLQFIDSADEIFAQRRPDLSFLGNRPKSPQIFAVDTLKFGQAFSTTSHPWVEMSDRGAVPPIWSRVWSLSQDLRLHGIRPSQG